MIVVNKSGSPVSNLDIALPNLAAVPHLRLTAQPLATPYLAPGEEAKLLVAIDCMRPYVDCPDFDVSFTLSGRPHRYALRLPLAPCAFFDPAVCDKATYMQRWNALGPECEVKDVFACFRAVDAAFMNQVRNNLSTGKTHTDIHLFVLDTPIIYTIYYILYSQYSPLTTPTQFYT